MIPVLLAQLADLVTGLMLPAGKELNPLSALLLSFAPAAVAAKAGLVALIVTSARRLPRRGRLGMLAFGTLVGLVGFGSNLTVLAS